jgi:short-subunit dehydrogenase
MKKENKVVVVTGASAGVGRATALAFGKMGMSVGLISRNQERLESLKKEIEALGGRAFIAIADMADPEKVENAAQMIEDQLGPIDIWVNNAMTSVFGFFKEIPASEFKRVTEVTYLGFVHGTRAALKRMLKRDKGVIVQVGSALAFRGIPLQSAYCGAKHAIQGFTESVRTELMHEKSHIKITIVNMPALNTPQFDWVKSYLPRKPQPVPPIYQPEVAANAIVWAAFHHRTKWYVGISTLIAVWGNGIAPWFADWYLARNGVASQQYNGKADPNRPNDLFESVNGEYGAHGDFDKRAHSQSPYLWMSQHREFIWLAIIALLILAWYFLGG